MPNPISNKIRTFIDKYISHSASEFKKSEYTSILEQEIPNEILNLSTANNAHLIAYGSVGQSRWSDIPWFAILDDRITKSTRRGYYVVGFLSASTHTLCLSLATGCEQFIKEYGGRTGIRYMQETCTSLAEEIVHRPENFSLGAIHLGARTSRAKNYEKSCILSKCFDLDTLTDEELAGTLKSLLRAYDELKGIVGNDLLNYPIEPRENDTKISNFQKQINLESLGDDPGLSLGRLESKASRLPPKIRQLVVRRISRNRKFAEYIKKRASYICEICGRKPFIQKNRGLYAEADHIEPLGGKTRGIDHPDNMRCLCAQCHAVITYGDKSAITRLLTNGRDNN